VCQFLFSVIRTFSNNFIPWYVFSLILSGEGYNSRFSLHNFPNLALFPVSDLNTLRKLSCKTHPVSVIAEVEVKLRPTVSMRVSLGVRQPFGTRNQFFFRLEIFFRQLRVCYFVAPSLTRGRVCNLLLLLVLTSAVPLWSEPRGTQDHILLSQFLRLSQLIPPRNRVNQIYPRALGSLSVASYDLQCYGGGILSRHYKRLCYCLGVV
jgi:hypothetical protein